MQAFGYKLKGSGEQLRAKDYQKILNKIKGKPEERAISSVMLRSMNHARYEAEQSGHFGLACEYYTHFTSPIRRYPDLAVHRMIKELLAHDGNLTDKRRADLEKRMKDYAEQSSMREKIAEEAERDSVDMKMAEYMESHIGEIYEGVISSVTSFGFFVELPNLIEGLVHVNSLKGDYFNYVPELLSLIGNTTKKTYRIGDKVKVKCVGASKERAMIDFEVVKEDKDTLKKKPKSSK